MVEYLFWIALFIIIYTYIGYGMLLYMLVLVRRLVGKRRLAASAKYDTLPSCTVVVAAYNEAPIIRQKIDNTLGLRYPTDRIRYIFVTDGSTDDTPALVSEYPAITSLHQPTRYGKIAAVHRAMHEITTDVVVFTDANTLLNPDALIELCKHYEDKQIGAVAGEKRVYAGEEADASAAGEGFYWKYESALKKWDSELYTVVGTAGELFSIRRNLYESVSLDTILDDFMISMRIAGKGYRVVYEPGAFATEMASENVQEELKRKIRIAAGGIQSVIRLKKLLNPFICPVLTFQYVSHRVLRWTLTPILLPIVFILNALLHFSNAGIVYSGLFYAQLAFYGLAFLGHLLERKALKIKITFIPYYFCIMNYAVLGGMLRYFKGKQSAVWERSNRKQSLKADYNR
ncbi:glycosyl transferase [Parapedobacter defluvii]|uniref:Glycosyl transferase n=1 Tax=Parapedobacter defluvii TaxID=2045106 RepID=A0ABQ1MXA5_9SPHI|nr:glycosyltransferase family 2 protein [Parapedobacter defluvii]GGC48823.1 glycosyl transferase [Parapedobacter defluvii]